MASSLQLPLLDSVRIASPCPVKWQHMTPIGAGERVRYCDQCRLNVHNMSDMTRDEAEAFLRSIAPGERMCGSFWRRADGTILTRDCPVGLRAARQKLIRWVTRAAAAITVVLTGAAYARARSSQERWWGGLASLAPFNSLTYWVRGKPAPPPAQFVQGGLICLPPTQPPASNTPQAGGP